MKPGQISLTRYIGPTPGHPTRTVSGYSYPGGWLVLPWFAGAGAGRHAPAREWIVYLPNSTRAQVVSTLRDARQLIKSRVSKEIVGSK